MTPLIIILLTIGACIGIMSIWNHARQESRHEKAISRLITDQNRLVNLVMELDVRVYELRIAAGEISPESTYEVIDLPLEEPGERSLIEDLKAVQESRTGHPYSDECTCDQCEHTFTMSFLASLKEHPPLPLEPFDDFDDLTVEDLEPHEERDLRCFSGVHDPKITKLTEIMGIGGGKHAQPEHKA